MIKNSVLTLLSQFIIFNFTCKSKYGAASKWNEIDIFSLFFLNLGIFRIFIISFSIIDKKFKLIRVLKYADIAEWPTKNSIKEIMERNSQNCIEKFHEAINYKLEQENQRYSVVSNKTAQYVTILVFLIPLYFTLFVLYGNFRCSLIFAILAAYMLLGCIFIICYILYVKNSARSGMDELRLNIVKAKYFDWQIKKQENDFFVGLIKNLEELLLFSIIFAVIAGTIGLVSNNRTTDLDQMFIMCKKFTNFTIVV